MAKISITLPTDRSFFETLVRINGEDFKFRYLWNGRASKWYMTIYDAAGTVLQGATKVVVNYPLTTLTVTEDLFDGSLWAIDTSGQNLEARLQELGSRVIQLHRDSGG